MKYLKEYDHDYEVDDEYPCDCVEELGLKKGKWVWNTKKKVWICKRCGEVQ